MKLLIIRSYMNWQTIFLISNMFNLDLIGSQSISSKKIPVIFDSSSMHFQIKLVQMVTYLKDLFDKENIQLTFHDVSTLNWAGNPLFSEKMRRQKVLISLLDFVLLKKFVTAPFCASNITVYTPTALQKSWKPPNYVSVKSLQMSQEAQAVAVVNKVAHSGVKSLVPVLTSDYPCHVLNVFKKLARQSGIKVLRSIDIGKNNSLNYNEIVKKLLTHAGFSSGQIGVLYLGRPGSDNLAETICELGRVARLWFTPNIDEFLGLADKLSGKTIPRSITVSSLSFIGSDLQINPSKNRLLKRLGSLLDPSPILHHALLTIDAIKLATSPGPNVFHGLSGNISFTSTGSRDRGAYAGISVMLGEDHDAQTIRYPFTFYEDDTSELEDNREKKLPEAFSYRPSQYFVLTFQNIARIRESFLICPGFVVNITVFNPFTLLPHTLTVIPIQSLTGLVISMDHGIGLTVACKELVFRFACTARNMSLHDLTCFRSRHPLKRDKRAVGPDLDFKMVRRIRRIMQTAAPYVGGCIGTTFGCSLSTYLLDRLPLITAPGMCFTGTFASCGNLIAKALSETTVICTELFRQGKMDVETFLADAEFGVLMRQKHPHVFQAYQVLASPLVQIMRESKHVSDLVGYFALPWANHMKYLIGWSNEGSVMGEIVHNLGGFLCQFIAQVSKTISIR